MSAPDYNDPESRLKLSVRPMAGSGIMMAVASGMSFFAAVLSLLLFGASFLPGVEVSGSPFWALGAAIVFCLGGALFYGVHRLLRD